MALARLLVIPEHVEEGVDRDIITILLYKFVEVFAELFVAVLMIEDAKAVLEDEAGSRRIKTHIQIRFDGIILAHAVQCLVVNLMRNLRPVLYSAVALQFQQTKDDEVYEHGAACPLGARREEVQ